MIVVLVETLGDEVVEVSREALTFARRFGEPLRAVVVGGSAAGVAAQLGRYGVQEVVEVTGDGFSAYAPAVWAAAVQAVVLDGDTSGWSSPAPRVATRSSRTSRAGWGWPWRPTSSPSRAAPRSS